MSVTWKELGSEYLGESAFTRAVFDTIAPVAQGCYFRVPGVNLGMELAINSEEAWKLALLASNAVLERTKDLSLKLTEISATSGYGLERCTDKSQDFETPH